MQNTDKIWFMHNDHQKQLDQDRVTENGCVKDFIHKVRPPGSSPLPPGREAARFLGFCQVLQGKNPKKKKDTPG